MCVCVCLTPPQDVHWGIDLATEHERYLSEVVYKQPVVVYDYPKEIKAFYMRLNDDGKTVAAMDVLVPKVGELIGGSQREDRCARRQRKAVVHKRPVAHDTCMTRFGGCIVLVLTRLRFGLGLSNITCGLPVCVLCAGRMCCSSGCRSWTSPLTRPTWT